MKSPFLLALIFLATSCATPDANLASWVGHHQAELIQSWGAPSLISDDGQGGRVLVYARNVHLPRVIGGGEFAAGANNMMPNQVQQSRQFFVNQRGIIYLIR